MHVLVLGFYFWFRVSSMLAVVTGWYTSGIKLSLQIDSRSFFLIFGTPAGVSSDLGIKFAVFTSEVRYLRNRAASLL